MDNIEKLKEKLNEQQLEAVTSTEGYIRVVAGAGSGKTRALTSRYIYLVEALGINTSNILCVTFTNKAAQEMRTRVKKILGAQSDLSYITTYHGFCVRVLREDINKIQYPKKFIIIDVDDQKTILRSIFNEFGLTSKDYTFKNVLGYIGERKISGDYLKYILEFKKHEGNDGLERIFMRYLEKQQRNFALDFEDLINFTIYIFNKYPDTLEKWQKRLQYIQVDETQDSSGKQFGLVESLALFHKNLFVVGDPDQTIYEWRGAKPELLVDFDKKYTDSRTIIMNQNYRSTPNILNLGNHIIRNNKLRVDKDMFTNNCKGVEVVHFHGKNEDKEGLWIASEIKRLVEDENCVYSDFAILYRAHYISRYIEQSFIRQEIPYSIFGGIKFFERKEIKDVLAYLRLVETGDDISFLRIVNTPSRKLGKKFISNVAEIAERNNVSLFVALKSNITDKNLNKKGAIDFLNLVNRFKKRKDILNISDLVKEIMDESGLSEYFRIDGDNERLDNIKELQDSIIMLESQDEERLLLSEFLQEIALYTDMDIEDEENDKVKLMTIHISKGLEFPYVFLCGFTEGVLPSAMSLKFGGPTALEEERRLTYVAITRAEKAFYMTESEGFSYGSGFSKYPSRFLFEISESFYVRQGVLSQEVIDEAKQSIKNNSSDSVIKSQFKEGDLVKHDVFGKGEILKINKNQTYEIKFIESKISRVINFEFKGLKLISKPFVIKGMNSKKHIHNTIKSEFRPGDFVRHDIFGKGCIIESDDIFYHIKFKKLKDIKVMAIEFTILKKENKLPKKTDKDNKEIKPVTKKINKTINTESKTNLNELVINKISNPHHNETKEVELSKSSIINEPVKESVWSKIKKFLF